MSRLPLVLTALLACCAAISLAQVEVEPNDAAQQATAIGTIDTVQGSISPIGDEDWFAFDVPRAGVITATVFNVPGELEMELTLFDAANNEIDDQPGSPTGGATVNFEERVCEAGTYYTKLNDSRGNETDDQLYTLIVGLDTSDVYECNDEFDAATTIELPDTIQAAINPPKAGPSRDAPDVDIFSFTVPRSGVITTTIFNVPNAYRAELTLYDAQQNEVASLFGSASGATVNFEYLLQDPGTYYMQVSAWLNQGFDAQLYTLIVGLDTTDASEYNNDFASATPLATCDTARGTIRSRGDVDLFAFTGEAGDSLELRVFDVPAELRLQATLFDEQQNELGSSGIPAAGSALSYPFVVDASGTYYLALAEWLDQGSSADAYRLVLDAGCAVDTTMATDTTGTADTTSAVFDSGRTLRFRSYPNPTSDYLTLELPEETLATSVTIRVFDEVGRLVLRELSGAGPRALDVHDLPLGTYTVQVEMAAGPPLLSSFTKVQ